MASATSGGINRLRRPEYTGENRCIPCTITNLVIAAAISVVISRVASIVVAVLVFTISTILIYFRGYLIPWTPMLTRRYFPAWLLSLFDKHESQVIADDDAIDIENELIKAGVLVECENADDLCLHEEFRKEWQDRIDSAQRNTDRREVLADLLDINENQLRFKEYDDGGAFVALTEDNHVGQWESRAAFQADIAAAELLRIRIDEWVGMSTAARSQLLGGLRLFLDVCPVCGENLTLGADTVESCCRSIDVVAVTCTGCASRLFEIEHQPAKA